ncbi:response regulator [Candidatus Sulfurimonas marisnigri]|uniref:Response regulator n=1 Tax=Candidatus Sulfurimonas marisnigri TaxID=2740405 RepID=A0A7S7RR58_9BACT|nr:response regulator [Candidatus Sulfurimonas marisnigri]QOY55303.1 response regulator [Candidatus Sulfurimonas marisnigri]
MNINERLKKEAQYLSVLYVEDEEDTRKQISQILELFFQKVFIAKDGLDAIEVYRYSKADLVMTDLTMPNMDGLTMVKEIKKINNNQHVIILTAHNSSENLMETIDLQLDGFLLKPIKMDKMLELLLKISHMINLEKNEK